MSVHVSNWPFSLTRSSQGTVAVKLTESFQHGTYRVPGDMTARLHAGEMVLPREEAERVRANVRDTLAAEQPRGQGAQSVVIQFNMQGAILPDRASLEAWAEEKLVPILRAMSRGGVTILYDSGIEPVTRGRAA